MRWSQTNQFIFLTLETQPIDVQVHVTTPDNRNQLEFIINNKKYPFYINIEHAEIRNLEVLTHGRNFRIRFEKFPLKFWKRKELYWSGGQMELDWDHYEDSDDDDDTYKTFDIRDNINSDEIDVKSFMPNNKSHKQENNHLPCSNNDLQSA